MVVPGDLHSSGSGFGSSPARSALQGSPVGAPSGGSLVPARCDRNGEPRGHEGDPRGRADPPSRTTPSAKWERGRERAGGLRARISRSGFRGVGAWRVLLLICIPQLPRVLAQRPQDNEADCFPASRCCGLHCLPKPVRHSDCADRASWHVADHMPGIYRRGIPRSDDARNSSDQSGNVSVAPQEQVRCRLPAAKSTYDVVSTQT